MEENFKILVKKARQGDRHSFSLLYSKIYKDLYRYAFYALKNKEDAEDAVSEAVIDAYRSIGRLKNEDCFRSWFFKILSFKCKRRLKQYATEKTDELTESPVSEDLDIRLDLHLAMNLLDGDERMIIGLKVFGGYNSDEISKALKINRSTVRSKYSRALKKLQTALSCNGEV